MKDRQGDVWIGTDDAGAIRYDGRRFHGALTVEDGLALNRLRAILEDSAGHLWFGTYGSGISRYDGDMFRHMRRRDGLPHDRIYDIIEDRKGDVWIATLGGLARYRPGRTPPVVSLTQVIADERYGPVSEISIPTSQAFVIFEFRAPSLDVA
jgi:ligand-binding sensor domain-containing protein